jgi:hypothetical protein
MLAGVLCLLGILAAELTLSVRQESQTYDEAIHLYAGCKYWQASDFGVNPQHPPLAKLVASAPVLILSPYLKVPPFKSDGWKEGRELLYSNDADALLFRAREAASIFTLLLALLIFEASSCMFGTGPAFLALGLLVFEPNILAHGALVATDMAVTCCLFAAVYAFYRYVKQPSALRLAECGFIAGLALAAKHSGVLIFPILGLLALAEVLMGQPPRLERHSEPSKKPQASTVPTISAPARSRHEPGRAYSRLTERGGLSCVGPTSYLPSLSWNGTRGRQALRLASALLVTGGIAWAVLWAFYVLRFQARPGNLKMTAPITQYTQYLKHPVESLILGLERRRLLPESYLSGLAFHAAEHEKPAFVLGRFYPTGRWFYFPAAFIIKSTLGFLLLLLLTLGARRLYGAELRREVLFITIPAVLYFAVSLTSGLDIGIRHLLPVYPFFLVLAAVGGWSLMKQHRGWAYIVAALVAFHVVSSLRSFPDYLAYSNEAWGGPAKTYRVLTDSNVDWGQGLKAAKRYLDGRRITECWLAYMWTPDPKYYHIPCKLLHSSGFGDDPEVDVPETVQGTVLIGATDIGLGGPGDLNPYEPFLRTRPVANIGGCILVFEGQFDFRVGSAFNRMYKAWELARSNHLDQALAEARTAVALLPRRVESHYMLGVLLTEANQTDEARREYQAALSLARTIHPDYQEFWIPYLENALAAK